MAMLSCTVAVVVAAVDRRPSTDHWQMHKEGLVIVEEESGDYHYLEDSYY